MPRFLLEYLLHLIHHSQNPTKPCFTKTQKPSHSSFQCQTKFKPNLPYTPFLISSNSLINAQLQLQLLTSTPHFHSLLMELSSSFIHFPNPSTSTSSPCNHYSFSSSFSPFPIQIHTKNLKFANPTCPNHRIFAVAVDPQGPQQELPKNSPQRLLRELAERKRGTAPKKKFPPKKFILRPPLDDKRLAERFLNSPQLSLKAFPLLSSCLPSSRLNNADKTWMDEYLLEAKQALGYPLEPSENFGDDNPAKQFDTLLYLAFQHPTGERTRARHVRSGHTRLLFLGQYVLELALAEFFLQRYPRESPGPMRERVYALIGKKHLPKWIKAASLQNLVFPFDDMDKLKRMEREPPVK